MEEHRKEGGNKDGLRGKGGEREEDEKGEGEE